MIHRPGFRSRIGKVLLRTLVLLTLTLTGFTTTQACTTFIAGRQVTTDGSRIIGRTSDSTDLDVNRIVRKPAVNHPAPWTYTTAETKCSVQLPAKGLVIWPCPA
jgi:hypothetical protein